MSVFRKSLRKYKEKKKVCNSLVVICLIWRYLGQVGGEGDLTTDYVYLFTTFCKLIIRLWSFETYIKYSFWCIIFEISMGYVMSFKTLKIKIFPVSSYLKILNITKKSIFGQLFIKNNHIIKSSDVIFIYFSVR